MFTQSMPQLAQALSGALPEAALRQLMQALGNCQQPLSHRGAVNIQPPNTTGAGGLARPGVWRTSDYRDLLPTAGQDTFVDVAGDTYNNTNNTNNYDGHQFNFPINQDFNYNNYFGGDTFNVAGNSTFENTTINNTTTENLNTTNLNVDYINNTYVGQAGRDGASGRDGRDGITTVLFGGGGFVPMQLPFTNGRTRILKSVLVSGTVGVPHATNAYVFDKAVTVGTTDRNKEFTVTGTVEVPTVESASISAISASGTVTLPTVTGGSLSGATASGNISYDTYPTATCSTITGTVSLPTGGSLSGATAGGTISYDTYPTATCGTVSGTVSLPTTGALAGATASGTITYDIYPTVNVGSVTGLCSVPTTGSFTATPEGIKADASLGSLAGTVTIPIPTGGYLDASCKLVLTTTNQTYNVTFTGTPGVTISSQGSVAGSVLLGGITSRSLTIFGPSVTLNKSTATVTPTFTVAGGTVTLSGSTSRALSITTPTISLTKTAATAAFSAPVSGGVVSLTGSTATAVSITTPTVTLTKSSGSASASLTVNGGTFTPTSGSTTSTVTVSATGATVTLTAGTINVPASLSGSIAVKEPTGEGTLKDDEVSLDEEQETKKLDITVGAKADILVYLRPRL